MIKRDQGPVRARGVSQCHDQKVFHSQCPFLSHEMECVSVVALAYATCSDLTPPSSPLVPAMKITQLSVFLENKPGHLFAICKKLSDEGVNILTLSLADTNQFGILRLIVPEWERAKQILRESGCVVSTTEVVATQIADRPGGLAEILAILDAAGHNVEYMYAFAYHEAGRAILVFRFDDPDAAVKTLQEHGVGVLDSVELGKVAG